MPNVISGAKVFLGSLDLSGAANSVALNLAADAKEVTTLQDDTHVNVGGQFILSAQLEGYWNSTDDAELFTGVGGQRALTIAPDGAAEGNRAFCTEVLQAEYSPGAGVGEPLAYSVAMQGRMGLGRGVVELNDTLTASGNSAGHQLGAVASGQKLIAVVHALAVTGTLDVTVESDSSASFTSPTTVGTFATINAVGGVVLEMAGPITDTYFRLAYTVGGGSPSITVIGALGITP